MIGTTIIESDIESLATSKSRYKPKWTVDDGKGNVVGIAVDDHCFVVLTQTTDEQWRPTFHIPKFCVPRLNELFTGHYRG